jgi:hypothetical protein
LIPGCVGDEAEGTAEAEADGGMVVDRDEVETNVDGGIDVDGIEFGVEISGSGIGVGTGRSKKGG